VLFKGLRVRMGVHVGEPRMGKDPTTRKMEYYGPPVNAAARITAMTHGGQVVVSEALRAKFDAKDRLRIVDLGKFEMPDSPNGTFPP
jgi:class 3 adenylate cyclase